jgi:hypothetical protein
LNRHVHIEYHNVIFGFLPPEPIPESITTAIIRIIISKEREQLIPDEVINSLILDHCILNAFSKSKQSKEWQTARIALQNKN